MSGKIEEQNMIPITDIVDGRLPRVAETICCNACVALKTKFQCKRDANYFVQ